MNQPRPITLKSTVLAVIDLGLLFDYALAISLLARLLVFSNTMFGDNASNFLLLLAQFASSLIYLPSALLVRARLHMGQLPLITYGWAEVAHYASAIVNAVLWTGFILGARVVLRQLRISQTANTILPLIYGGRIRIAWIVVLLVLLGLTASPWTKESRVTAACADRLARLPIGTSIETVRAVLDHAWSDPVTWPRAATPAATSMLPPHPTPGIPNLDASQVDVHCTITATSIRREVREVLVRISFEKREVYDLGLYQCYHDSDTTDCVVPIVGSLQPLLGRPAGMTTRSYSMHNDDWLYDRDGVYPIYPPDNYR